ncbi:MAG: T9SS type A sorting domain-containing protein [Bacteroidales bacterium]|nr:T9SS type A sorting domain-containing protein [Bacteroidales bacterium]
MKKNFILSIGLLLATYLFSQSQRLVLLEHFTQASCPPCATWNPVVQAILNSNPDKITSIKYQVSWPGYDPMYLHNTQDVNSRVNYYNVNSVPYSVLDGNYYNGSPSGWNVNTVNSRYAVPSPFEIQLNHEISTGQDSVYVSILIEATDIVSGNLLAYITIIEKHIHFSSSPGSNGEKDFYNVMKKILPRKTGTSIQTSLEPGDYKIIQSAWEFANVYDINEIAAVGFVQNGDTKEVHQSANSSTDQITPLYGDDAEIIEILNVSDFNCLGLAEPHIILRNNGTNNLSSLDIYYQINEGELQTYQWTGNISTLQTEKIELSQFDFIVEDENLLTIYSSNPNGNTDEYIKNDTIYKDFIAAPVTSTSIRIIIITDNNPEETTWDIINSNEEVILSGGPYDEPGHIYQEIYDITVSDCYKYIIYDSGGNGLCCENGQGAWGIYDGSIEIDKGGIFGYRDSTAFQVDAGVGIIDKQINNTINIYPNPFENKTYISFNLSDEKFVQLNIYSITGEIVYTSINKILQKGEHKIELTRDNFKQGIYFIHLRIGDNIYSDKLILLKK